MVNLRAIAEGVQPRRSVGVELPVVRKYGEVRSLRRSSRPAGHIDQAGGNNMVVKKFILVGRVNTDNPVAINAALKKVIPQGTIEQTETNEFLLKAEFSGENARELNRSLLTELRRAEKRTRLRAEWTSGNVTEKFFDYVPKSVTEAK